MNSILKEILDWIYCIIIAVVIGVTIKYFLGTFTMVQQESMYPTLIQGDRLVLNRIPRTTKKIPKRGDIITFEAPSKVRYDSEEIDLQNPIAKYEKKLNGVFKKFTYNVLEIGKTSYIKRAIGLPGEHIQIKDGKVYINGEQLEESYLNESVITEAANGFDDIIVPENCIFAMGDNRAVSMDCRSFGCIPLEKIESKVVLRFWPINKFGKVK